MNSFIKLSQQNKNDNCKISAFICIYIYKDVKTIYKYCLPKYSNREYLYCFILYLTVRVVLTKNFFMQSESHED